jgi:hypothetical protein
MGNFSSIEKLRNSETLNTLLSERIQKTFELQSKYKNETSITTEKDMQTQNIGSNVVDTG